MRGPSAALWLFLALRTVLGGMEVRWCTISDPEQQKCSDMSKAFQEAGIQPSLLCVQGTSADHCIQLISAQEADAITLDGGAIYEAGKEHGLKPVVGEVYDQEVGTSYYAVAVVKRGSHVTINTLKGVKSCHTGINRTVGWNVPVGYLVDSGRLSVMGCDVLKAVSDYFGGSCVPGAGETSHSQSLCRLCRGNAAGEGVCDKSPLERYYDYSGAFRCLAEGAGDVAFVKHSTVLENTDGKTLASWGQVLLSKDFELLCRDGSRADVTEWRRCHLARVPAHAVVVRADTDGGLIFRLLNEGQLLFSHDGSSFQMFSSEAYGQKNLLFKDATSELVPIATQTYEAWLGREYLHAMKGLLCDPNRLPHYLRWCVLSTPEIQKCGDMAVAFSRQRLKPEIQCVSAESPQHCIEQIQAGQIDAVTLRGEDIYTAGKTYGLIPAAGEHYAPEDRSNSYFVVAVVKRNSSYAFTLDELRGKRSCHPAFGNPTGWDIPVGALVQKGFIRPRHCDVLTGAWLRMQGTSLSSSTRLSSTTQMATMLSPGLLSSGWRTMSSCVPMGPGPRYPSLQPATWHRYRPMPSWSGQTPTSSLCMDCWTRPRTCLEMTTIRMGSKCSTPPTIMARTCFSRMLPSGQCLWERKPRTMTGWARTMWRLWKGCCLSSARAQGSLPPGCSHFCCCSHWPSLSASFSPPSEAAVGKPRPPWEWKPVQKSL
nr:melanotransferrin isoform X2 [Vicugna pacos]